MNCICPQCYGLRNNANKSYSCGRCGNGYLLEIECYQNIFSDIMLHKHPIRFTLFAEKGFCYNDNGNSVELPIGAVRVIGAEYINQIYDYVPVLPPPTKREHNITTVFTTDQTTWLKNFCYTRVQLLKGIEEYTSLHPHQDINHNDRERSMYKTEFISKKIFSIFLQNYRTLFYNETESINDAADFFLK